MIMTQKQIPIPQINEKTPNMAEKRPKERTHHYCCQKRRLQGMELNGGMSHRSAINNVLLLKQIPITH